MADAYYEPWTSPITHLLPVHWHFGCECEAVGAISVGEQWAYSQRTGGEFVASLKQAKIPVKIRPSALPNSLLLCELEMEARSESA